jgi:DNA-binding MarR family transcriptional regulator|tara:strand:+ start:600 stop:1289 length:690 start_codon:yes stop_codon:yes gene_type:complete
MEKPNYYAVLTSEVRYDKRLTAFAKLMYAEVTALANKEGYCWANNSFFAKNYETTERTVQRALSSLEEYGYIRKEITNHNTERKLYITMTKQSEGVDKTVSTSPDKKVIHNNTSSNNKKEYIYKRDLEDFGKFWNKLQGRKVAKPSALKAYVQIDTELSAEELAQKFNLLLNSREEKFCPYPQKWLKNEGWNDEVNNKITGHVYMSDDEVYRDADGYIISKKEYEKLYK